MHPLEMYLEQNHKTHIIFDFDATLFLLVLPWSEKKNVLRQKLIEYDASIWDAYQQRSINVAEMENQYMKNHGDAVRDFLRTYGEDFEDKHLQAVEYNHDLLAAIRRLDPTITKYIWSSNSRKTIDKILGETDLEDAFAKIITRDDVQYLKPNPEGFQEHIHNPEVPLPSYLMVGDSNSDRRAAAAADIDFYLTDTFDQGRL